ncbi:hypothetical protein Tco_0410705 [Tanacetum coccineum]
MSRRIISSRLRLVHGSYSVWKTGLSRAPIISQVDDPCPFAIVFKLGVGRYNIILLQIEEGEPVNTACSGATTSGIGAMILCVVNQHKVGGLRGSSNMVETTKSSQHLECVQYWCEVEELPPNPELFVRRSYILSAGPECCVEKPLRVSLIKVNMYGFNYSSGTSVVKSECFFVGA